MVINTSKEHELEGDDDDERQACECVSLTYDNILQHISLFLRLLYNVLYIHSRLRIHLRYNDFDS